MPSVRSIRRSLGEGVGRTAAVALSAALIGGGTVAAVDVAREPAPAPAIVTDASTPTAATSSATAAAAAAEAATGNARGLDVSALYERRRGGVVSITATLAATGGPGLAPGGGGTATGSGVVIDDDGHVLTNEHVVDGATAIRVELADGTTADATVVGTDPSTDLAVLEIDVPAEALDPIPLGDSSALEVGDAVLAIGDPFGYRASASTGIVSGLDRSIQAPNGYTITGAIQTDAAVNHGNSGGALLDAGGDLIGIPSQIADSGVDGNVGVAFAVPSDTAERVVEAILSDGEVEHAWLGVSTATVDAGLAGVDGVGADSGALVTAVTPGGPAARAGLGGGDATATADGAPVCVGGDVVTAVGDTAVTDAADLQEAVDARAPGDEVVLTVVAADGTGRRVTVTLGTRPATTGEAAPAACG